MPDAVFEDPRLARVYDPLDPDAPDRPGLERPTAGVRERVPDTTPIGSVGAAVYVPNGGAPRHSNAMSDFGVL